MLDSEYQDSVNRPETRSFRQQAQSDRHRLLEQSIASIREALSDLNFGTVSLTVHDGRVVQIDVTEKRRLRLT